MEKINFQPVPCKTTVLGRYGRLEQLGKVNIPRNGKPVVFDVYEKGVKPCIEHNIDGTQKAIPQGQILFKRPGGKVVALSSCVLEKDGIVSYGVGSEYFGRLKMVVNKVRGNISCEEIKKAVQKTAEGLRGNKSIGKYIHFVK